MAGNCPVSERSYAEEKDVGNKRKDTPLKEKEIVWKVEKGQLQQQQVWYKRERCTGRVQKSYNNNEGAE